MKTLMSLLLAVALTSPVAFARLNSDVATSTSQTRSTNSAVSAAIMGDHPGSDCAHSKKKLNARYSDTNPRDVIMAEVFGAQTQGQVQ